MPSRKPCTPGETPVIRFIQTAAGNGEVLSSENGRQLYIPEGFAHGFMALEDDTEIVYKCSDFYAPDREGAVRFDDPGIGIAWPDLGVVPTLSDKDARAPLLSDINSPFKFEGLT